MSDSRLEKFIYAICSMEVSDLPAPLSRIEILWNCLITGETPDFEPQSRHEIYLMAMLDLYDIENLPTPMSRDEKLLYKIAVGDTDLSDIPAYLSLGMNNYWPIWLKTEDLEISNMFYTR